MRFHAFGHLAFSLRDITRFLIALAREGAHMNEHETSAAIADETVIDAIEGAQAVDAVTADESSNPADP